MTFRKHDIATAPLRSRLRRLAALLALGLAMPPGGAIGQTQGGTGRTIMITPNETVIEEGKRSALALAVAAAADIPLKLAVRGAALAQDVEGTTLVRSEADADLIYDSGPATVEKPGTGTVADHVDPAALPAIVAKWRTIAILKAAAGSHTLPFAVAGGDRVYRRGERLVVELTDPPHPFLTLFDLPPNGAVEFLYPASKAEHNADWRGRTFSLPLAVKDPPFGAEHLVAILSDTPLDQLQSDLDALATPDAAVALPSILRRDLGGEAVSIGIADIRTSGDGS